MANLDLNREFNEKVAVQAELIHKAAVNILLEKIQKTQQQLMIAEKELEALERQETQEDSRLFNFESDQDSRPTEALEPEVSLVLESLKTLYIDIINKLGQEIASFKLDLDKLSAEDSQLSEDLLKEYGADLETELQLESKQKEADGIFSGSYSESGTKNKPENVFGEVADEAPKGVLIENLAQDPVSFADPVVFDGHRAMPEVWTAEKKQPSAPEVMQEQVNSSVNQEVRPTKPVKLEPATAKQKIKEIILDAKKALSQVLSEPEGESQIDIVNDLLSCCPLPISANPINRYDGPAFKVGTEVERREKAFDRLYLKTKNREVDYGSGAVENCRKQAFRAHVGVFTQSVSRSVSSYSDCCSQTASLTASFSQSNASSKKDLSVAVSKLQGVVDGLLNDQSMSPVMKSMLQASFSRVQTECQQPSMNFSRR